VLFVADWLFIRKERDNHSRRRRQIGMIVLSLSGIVAIILSLPVDSSVRNELLGLLGIVLTGLIAFSSTTFVANMMAGLMLRSVKSFSPGDFIHAGDHFGKVTELGLFHTEIQSEDRDLVTLPNLLLASNPVKVVRSSGTALNCSLSLGYDIPHQQVEKLLAEAALKAGLDDPFVQIMELGDFSVTYKAAGFYREVKHPLSAKSAFKAAILDTLHAAGVEIVSPTFMSQRVYQPETQVIPQNLQGADSLGPDRIFPETLLFDKADQAQKITMLQEKLASLESEKKVLEKSSTENDGKESLEQLDFQIKVAKTLLEREQIKENKE
jgi:small-conductance mechanosensitive channel